MSEQLEAAIVSLREADLAVADAEDRAAHGKDGVIGCIGDALGHTRNAVNHLAGAVQLLERWRQSNV